MLPQAIVIQEEKDMPSLTWQANLEKEKLTGKIDELEAVKQAVFLMLATERGYSEIYEGYGLKTVDLIGQDFYYTVSELKRRIKETLLEDDRITEVDNFKHEQQTDILSMTFDVYSIYGSFKVNKEVEI